MIGLNARSVDIFLRMVSMVLVPWGVCDVIGNGHGTQEQKYVALLQVIKIPAGFLCRNWILDIQCFRLIAMNVQRDLMISKSKFQFSTARSLSRRSEHGFAFQF